MRHMEFIWRDTQKGCLILVTPKYALQEAGKPKELGLVLSGQRTVTESEEETGIFLERKAARMLQKLLTDLGSGDCIVPVSGFRHHEEQVQIWEDTLRERGETFTRTYVAEPGHSEHECGLAIDLAANREEIDFICPEFPRTGIFGEFRRLAPQYGFTERYPAGSRSVTGIGEEPWHFRYVGVPHGFVMEREGLILEDYIAFLKEHTSFGSPYLCFGPKEGTCTEIFYADLRGKENISFRFSDCTRIQYSGTNEGGIVICRERR